MKKITDKITSTDVEVDLDNLVEFEFEVIGLYSGNKKTYKPQYGDLDSWNLHAIELSSKCIDEMIVKQEEALNAI